MSDWKDKKVIEVDPETTWFGGGYEASAWFFGIGSRLGVARLYNAANPQRVFTIAIETIASIQWGFSLSHKLTAVFALNVRGPSDLHGYRSESEETNFEFEAGLPRPMTHATGKVKLSKDVLDSLAMISGAAEVSSIWNKLKTFADILRSCTPKAERGEPYFTTLHKQSVIGVSAGMTTERIYVYSTGSAIWDASAPKWRLRRTGGRTLLEMEDIPVVKGEVVFLRFWDGSGGIGDFTKAVRVSGMPKGYSKYLHQVDGFAVRTENCKLNVDLSDMSFYGGDAWGNWELYPSLYEPFVQKRGLVTSVSAVTPGEPLWAAQKYASTTMSSAKIQAVEDADTWRL